MSSRQAIREASKAIMLAKRELGENARGVPVEAADSYWDAIAHLNQAQRDLFRASAAIAKRERTS